jgi:hypothetical protein
MPELRFTIYDFFVHEHPQGSETYTCMCAPPMREVLTKISLVHSYPGFFGTGNLSRARVSNRGRVAEIFA